MVSLDRCRELLGPTCDLSDRDIERVRDDLRLVAAALVQLYSEAHAGSPPESTGGANDCRQAGASDEAAPPPPIPKKSTETARNGIDRVVPSQRRSGPADSTTPGLARMGRS